MQPTINKPLFWIPRVLSLMFVAFLMLFSLDVFEPGRSAGEVALGLLIHNIPALVLLALTVVAWKRELVGAVTFFAAGLLYIALVFRGEVPWYLALSWSMILVGPAWGIATLYLVGWRTKRRSVAPTSATGDVRT
ncbi:hypothetical protein L0Y59_01735 [Candidatus Uhrbacteria bacterium]|nr:hypothetical protein [Candidatus Uhrbacteria bacterium]